MSLVGAAEAAAPYQTCSNTPLSAWLSELSGYMAVRQESQFSLFTFNMAKLRKGGRQQGGGTTAKATEAKVTGQRWSYVVVCSGRGHPIVRLTICQKGITPPLYNTSTNIFVD